MEINIDNEKVIIEKNKIIEIGNGWNTFEYSQENSPSPKLYYFKPNDVDLKAISFDEYVNLLTEGETIEGMLKKLNLKIDEYCEKQDDPKPKICTEKENIEELKERPVIEEKAVEESVVEEPVVEEEATKKLSDNKIQVLKNHIEKYPSIMNILKFI